MGPQHRSWNGGQRAGIQLSKSAVNRLLRHLGLSPEHPLYKSYKQNPKKVEAYLNNTFPKLALQAKTLRAQIYFKDSSKGDIIMAFIPPYSPELNPDEQVWNHNKARLSKRLIASNKIPTL